MSRRTCIMCGRALSEHEFIKDRNDKYSDRFGYCKACVLKSVNDDGGEPHDTLRMLNIPFVNAVWSQSISKEKEDITEYLKGIALRRTYRTYHDSEFNSMTLNRTIEITDEIRAKWGYEFNDLEYEELELSLKLLKEIKTPDSPLQEKMYITTVLLEKRYKTAILSGESGNSLKSIKDAYESSLTKLGLDQSSSKDDIEFVGSFIQKCEREGPIPEATRDFQDVDNVMKYLSKAFLTNAKRIFGAASDQESKDLYTNDPSIIPGSGNTEDGDN